MGGWAGSPTAGRAANSRRRREFCVAAGSPGVVVLQQIEIGEAGPGEDRKRVSRRNRNRSAKVEPSHRIGRFGLSVAGGRGPHWVTAIVLASLAAAIADLPSFVSTLDDAVVFMRVSASLDRGASSSAAIASLRRLQKKFPASMEIKIKLLAEQLLSGDSPPAQRVLDELDAQKLSDSEIKTINAWIDWSRSVRRPVQPSTH